MPRDRLFRQEVLDARSTQWLGTIRIAQPIADRAAAALAALVVAALVAFGTLGSYTRRATVPGLLEPLGGVRRLTTPAAGTVVALPVVEGQRVRTGEPLFVLSTERLSDSGPTLETIGRQLAVRRDSVASDLALSAARHASRLQGVADRLAAIDVELRRVDEEAVIGAARLRIAQANAARFETLAQRGFVAPAVVQSKVDDALLVEAQQSALRRVAAGLARERSALSTQREDSRLQADGERAEIARALALLDQERAENDARRRVVVAAPCDGIVTGIAVQSGQSTAAGALVATLVPDAAPLTATLYASTRQAGFVQPGQRVRLRYAAFPYQKFGMGEGRVDAIERSPYAPMELSAQAAATLSAASVGPGAEPVYRIVVRLESQSVAAGGREHVLRSGMVVEADVLQDRRRLVEWLLEPLYGMTGRT